MSKAYTTNSLIIDKQFPNIHPQLCTKKEINKKEKKSNVQNVESVWTRNFLIMCFGWGNLMVEAVCAPHNLFIILVFWLWKLSHCALCPSSITTESWSWTESLSRMCEAVMSNARLIVTFMWNTMFSIMINEWKLYHFN